jgi:Chondroitinase B
MKPAVHNGRSGRRLPHPATALLAAAATVAALTTVEQSGAGDISAARLVRVTSIAALQSAAAQAQPGDRIELAAGTYSTSGSIRLTRSGTAAAPITVAAERVGGVEIKGKAGFAFGAIAHVAVEGFRFTHAGGVSVPPSAHHVRLTRNLFQISSGSTTNWVTVSANDSEIDHNTFQQKKTVGVFLQIAGVDGDVADRVRIHHNYFFSHTFGGANGGESIRLGHSHRQHASARAVIEENLFERADGDAEAISVKSSDNVVRFNTLRNSRGGIVLRHGHRTVVDGNLLLGGRSGIRFYGNDHVIVNNLVQGSSGRPIEVGGGDIIDDTGSTTSHERADRVLVAFNTLVGGGELLTVGSSKKYAPDSCTFANNVLVGGGSGRLVRVNQGTKLRWQGNIVWAGTGGDLPSSGYRTVNPNLMLDEAGLNRLRAASPAIDTAEGSYPQATTDLDGQARSAAKDVGADEFVADAPTRRPLTTADVGPNAP